MGSTSPCICFIENENGEDEVHVLGGSTPYDYDPQNFGLGGMGPIYWSALVYMLSNIS